MTRTELRDQVGKAGKFCIEGMTKETYRKWFDSQTLFDDKKMENLMFALNSYNSWLVRLATGEECKDLVDNEYVALISMLNILDDIGYYDPDKYGDIMSFAHYCWSCWNVMQPVDFVEYEKIRAFFTD